MLTFCLKDEQVKIFMNEFLRGRAFDFFGVKRLEVYSCAKFSTDGRINPDFLPEGEERGYCLWAELKPYAFALIKGKIKPKIFKTVLSVPEDKLEMIHPNAGALHLTVSFENDRVVFLTGTAQKSFSLDKEVDRAWETCIKKFFEKHGFECETLE